MFTEEAPLQHLLRVLTTSAYGTKLKSAGGNKESSPLAVLAAEVLYLAFKDQVSWPLEFIDAYVDDAINCRMWVDAKESIPFVRNLLSWMTSESVSDAPPKPVSGADDSSSGEEEVVESSGRERTALAVDKDIVSLRFDQTAARTRLVHLLRSCLLEGKAKTNTFSLIETLTQVSDLSDIRPLLSTQIDKWIHNPAFSAALRILIERAASGIRKSYSASDNALIQTIVRTRLHLKNEDYRSVLQILVNGDSTLAAVTVKCIILLDDPLLKQLKPETAKLLHHVFQSIVQTVNRAELLGEVIVLIYEELKQSWSPLQSKVLLDTVVRLARGQSSGGNSVRELMRYLSLQSSYWEDASIDSDALKLFIDLFIAILLSLANELTALEKDSMKSSKTTHAEKPKSLSRPSSSLFISKPTAIKGVRQDTGKQSSIEEEKKLDPAAANRLKEDLLMTCCHLQATVLTTLTTLVTRSHSLIKFTSLSDIISKVLMLGAPPSSKAAADLNLGLAYIKDRGFVSLESILSVATLLQLSAATFEEMSAGIDMIEGVLQRGLKSKLQYDEYSPAAKVDYLILSFNL